MIISNEIKELGIFNSRKIIEFLKNNDVVSLTGGRYDLGDDCYVVVNEYLVIKMRKNIEVLV